MFLQVAYLQNGLKNLKSSCGRTISATISSVASSDITTFCSWGGNAKEVCFRSSKLGFCLICKYDISHKELGEACDENCCVLFRFCNHLFIVAYMNAYDVTRIQANKELSECGLFIHSTSAAAATMPNLPL